MFAQWKRILGMVFVLSLGLVACSGGADEPTPTAAPADGEAMEPSVTVSDQDAAAGTVTIDLVHAADPGWLVVHADNEGSPGPVIGHTQVNIGDNPNVLVEIDLAQATPQLHAMLHLDSGTIGEYEFPGDDVPVRVGDSIVNVPFQVDLPLASIDPSVTVSDQDATGGTVTIDLVHANEPGWLVIHANNDGAPGVVIGHTQVNVGDNRDVIVEIDLTQATPVLHAMLHLDAGTVGEYEFPGEDVPIFVDEVIVNVPFDAGLEDTAPISNPDDQYSVEIKDGRFEESALSVPVGATVVWRYDGTLPHTVTADNGEFDSPTLDAEGETFSFTFTEAGVYAYHCRFHGGPGGQGMSGTITVG